MKRTLLALVLVLTIAIVGRSSRVALGADGGALLPPMPKPSREIEQLDFFRGKWTCAGKQLASPFGPEHVFTGSSEDRVAADGFWHVWLYQEERSQVHLGAKVQGMWGWNPASKEFVRASGDSAGQWETATASGFEGNALRWSGKSSGPLGVFDFRSTFTKQGDRQWSHSLEIRVKDADFVRFQEVTCKK
jgi:Protein of unknown function (DUF1579)